MRLLNTETLRLQTFIGQPPSYAILSHTWGDDEVTHEEMLNLAIEPRLDESSRMRKGFQKIIEFCRKASESGYKWGWVDTCCIDKRSSSELSEAINSMFEWYSRAAVCFAYLADVFPFRDPGWAANASKARLFKRATWFTRGWTLQELIAPRHVEFYSSQWTVLGTKFGLRELIREATGIRLEILMGADVGLCCAAEKMSWAADRATTRPEDAAYCLLGIFGVNMSLIYGEGMRAYARLQQEILQREEDYSLLSWSGPVLPWKVSSTSVSALAARPGQFAREVPVEHVALALDSHGFIKGTEASAGDTLPREDIVCVLSAKSLPAWAEVELASASVQTRVNWRNFEPSALTNRGLKLNVMALHYEHEWDQDRSALVWTFCVVPYGRDGRDFGYLCVWLRASMRATVYNRVEHLRPVVLGHGDFIRMVQAQLYLSLASSEPLLADGENRDFWIPVRLAEGGNILEMGYSWRRSENKASLIAQHPQTMGLFPGSAYHRPLTILDVQVVGAFLVDVTGHGATPVAIVVGQRGPMSECVCAVDTCLTREDLVGVGSGNFTEWYKQKFLETRREIRDGFTTETTLSLQGNEVLTVRVRPGKINPVIIVLSVGLVSTEFEVIEESPIRSARPSPWNGTPFEVS